VGGWKCSCRVEGWSRVERKGGIVRLGLEYSVGVFGRVGIGIGVVVG